MDNKLIYTKKVQDTCIKRKKLSKALQGREFFKEMESTLNITISDDAVKEENSKASAEYEEECSTETLKDYEVESAKFQMTHVKEENTRLKMLLEQIENDYKSLQMRFIDIVQHESKRSHSATITNEDIEEPELVSLCLGRSPSESKKEDTTSSTSKTREDEYLKDGLKLGLDCNYGSSKMEPVEEKNDLSPDNSLVETKEEEAGETWPPSKVLKMVRSGDDELSQPTIKRARVCVRAKCDSPTLHDGCQWRKYGQKIAKGNPCPRGYYRCTVAPSCPVRKQVQRCAQDMSVLITTYEGTHNHPLPISATAMASTTSAAASMLLSGSSTSQPGFGSSTTPAINLSGLNVNLSDTSRARPYYLPNSSPQFPTITLDLTTSPSTSSTHFNMFSSSFQAIPRFPSTSLNFSSPDSTMLPSVWSNGYLNYGAQTFNKTPIGSSFQLSKPSQELCYQQYMEKNHQAASQQALAETLTKAISSDPSIQSVIAAAISSMVAGGKTQVNDNRGENFSQNMKWAEHVQVINSTPLTPNGKGCPSSFLNRSTSLDAQTGSLRPQQIPLVFSISNNSSRSTVDNRDQTN